MAIDEDAVPSTAACVQAGDPWPRLWFPPDLPGSASASATWPRRWDPTSRSGASSPPLLRGEPNTYASLDDLTARFVADLLVAQPDGPYWLGGFVRRDLRLRHGPPSWWPRATRSPSWAWSMRYGLSGSELAGQPLASLAVLRRRPTPAARRRPGRGGPPLRPDGAHQPQGRRTTPVAAHRAQPAGRNPRHFHHDLEVHGRVRPEWRLWYT